MTESRGESFDRLPNKDVAWEGEAPAEPLSLLGRSKHPVSSDLNQEGNAFGWVARP